MTMKESGNKSTRKFQELVDEDAKGMSEDEKMALAARKLEDKFKREDGNVKVSWFWVDFAQHIHISSMNKCVWESY